MRLAVSLSHSTAVLLGRGTGPNEHSGNRSFRDHIHQLKDQYTKADCRHGKDELAMEAINAVKAKGGRFLKKLIPAKGSRGRGHYFNGSFCTDLYELADHDTILEKTRQAFQYCCRQRKKGSNSASTTAGATAAADTSVASTAAKTTDSAGAAATKTAIAGLATTNKIEDASKKLQHIVDPETSSTSSKDGENATGTSTVNTVSPRLTAAATTVAGLSSPIAADALAKVIQQSVGGQSGLPYHLLPGAAAPSPASMESHFAAAAARAASEAAFYRDLALAEHIQKQRRQSDVATSSGSLLDNAAADPRLIAALLASAPKTTLPGVAGSLYGNLFPTASLASAAAAATNRQSLMLEDELARLGRLGGSATSAIPPSHHVLPQLLSQYGASPASATTATTSSATTTASTAASRNAELLQLAEQLVRQRDEAISSSPTNS